MSIVSASNQEPVIELEAGNAVVMGAEPETGFGALEREDNDATVRATRNKGITAKLQLADERSMALKQCRADTTKKKFPALLKLAFTHFRAIRLPSLR